MDYTFKEVSKTIHFRDFDDYINVWLFGDVHRETKACDVERWKWFLKKAAKDDPEKTYYIGMGDYHDFASTSEKKQLRGDKVHETTDDTLDFLAEKHNRDFAGEIKQMQGKLLGLIHGNHSWLFLNGKNSTEDLAERMQCEYLGWLCHLKLTFIFGSPNTRRTQNVHFILCHGKAGGKLLGTSINQVEDMKKVIPAADVYAMGHDHQRGAWPTSILDISAGGGNLKQKRQYICRTGSFKKAYTVDTSSYEASRLLRPADLGAIKLIINFHRDQSKGRDIIITDIHSFT